MRFWQLIWMMIKLTLGFQPPWKQWVDLYNHHCWTLRVEKSSKLGKKTLFSWWWKPRELNYYNKNGETRYHQPTCRTKWWTAAWTSIASAAKCWFQPTHLSNTLPFIYGKPKIAMEYISSFSMGTISSSFIDSWSIFAASYVSLPECNVF